MVDAVLRVVLQNINSLLQQEFALVWGVDREMRRLSNTLATIRDVLEDAEEKQFKDKAIRSWLKKLKDAAYDADDILDECAVKALQFEAQMGNCGNCTNQVSHSFLSWFNFKQLMFRLKIGHKIKDIIERFDDIADERSKFHLNPRGTVECTVAESSTERETSTILPTEHPVYGREDDREKIVELLLANSSNPDLLVYPIIGIGGLGKTTLAQLVYNDERVKNHFGARIWVCVSDDFDVKGLTKAIVESMDGNACELKDLDPMQSRLREKLRQRFLLILDDVWNEDQEKWDRVKSSLKCGIEGCSILVTTRNVKVASIMGTFPAHHLKGLSKNDSWSLFKQRALGNGKEENETFVMIGKEIVKKCGGVPLAAKALGSLMRFKHTEPEWQFVRDSEIWDLPEDEENTILPALRLSYNHLPSHLRQCFSYCSIFPKGHWIQKEQLVLLWMANGFILSKGKMELEDIGNEIFNELLWRSFFQDVEKNDYGIVVRCKMHDLVHDLACSVMDNECLTLDQTSKEKIVPKGIRHLSMKLDESSDSEMLAPSTSESLRKSQTIHTLLLDVESAEFHVSYKKLLTHFNFSNHRCLRALDLSFEAFDMDLRGMLLKLSLSMKISQKPIYLPSSVAYLIHLRYLNLSGMKIRTLPESLSNLKHLQTLKLFNCPMLRKLPTHMSTMSSLRHLDIRKCNSLRQMPIGLGKLVHLQTLSFFIVGEKNGCHISELQGLNLRGSLQINSLGNVKNSMEAKEANLIRKRNLHSLSLSWSTYLGIPIEENTEEVLEGLQPPASIKALEIEGYMGMKFPSWMDDLSLQNLVHVVLKDCTRCEHLPPLAHLPLLKFLELRSMDSIQYLGADQFYSDGDLGIGFPLLKELVLFDMLNLEGLFLNVGEGREVVLPCLVSMTIINCDKLKTLPLLPSLQRLHLQTRNESVPEGLLQSQNLPVLHKLVFNNSCELITLPRLSIKPGESGFCSLIDFRVFRCHAMKSLWEDETQFQGFSSLMVLTIHSCNRIASLSGMRYLTALMWLYINDCPELELSQLEDFRYLTSLEVLIMSSLPKLTSLPKWIHNLTSLRTMEISYCRNLTFLPDDLQLLTKLQSLKIEECPRYPTLPRSSSNL